MPGHLLAGGHYDWCLRMVLFKCIALGEQMCRRKFMVYACMRLDVVQVLYAKKHFFLYPVSLKNVFKKSACQSMFKHVLRQNVISAQCTQT